MKRKLSLDTKIAIKDACSVVRVGEILSGLNRRFPDGFYAAESTAYFISELGGVPMNFAGRHGNNASLFYKALAENGFLEDHKEEPTHAKGHVKHRYRIKASVVESYFPPERRVSHTLRLPKGLVTLMDTYSRLVDTSPDDKIQGVLETTILEDKNFLGIMEAIKARSPEGYLKNGGRYLDKLFHTQTPKS